MRQTWTITAAISALAIIVTTAWRADAEQNHAAAPDFVRDIQPIFAEHCNKCHGPTKQEGGVRWDRRAVAFLAADSGHIPVVPGDVHKSHFIELITAKDPKERMPKQGKPLTAEQIDLLKRWVEAGAPWPQGVDPVGEGPQHWAFVIPTRPERPAHGLRGWSRHAIDDFIAAKLEAAGLAPAPQADRHTFIRRLSLDLTGLPPTPEEVDAFVSDASPDAYEKLVDRLLASPAYGERWARLWLDLARYADSAGYGSDPLRLNIWPYRDWLIEALNANMPFDQFTIEQLAGDLLPDPKHLPTAFHRNTMTNTEGGTDDEEFRVAAVKDRANTTAQVWMGLTMGCAQCHSHKYDPITMRDYYRFYALFNQTADNDQPNERPTMAITAPSQQRRIDALRAEIAALQREAEKPTPELLAAQRAWEKRLVEGEKRWTPVTITNARSADGAQLNVQHDGSVLAGADRPTSDTYLVEATSALPRITAIRLEALPHESLPRRGPGRTNHGNFVLTELRLAAGPSKYQPLKARYVRIELPGKQRILSLAEVQVFSGAANVALRGEATQSSTGYDGPAPLAIDGNTEGNYTAKSVTHSEIEDDPWWELDLGAAQEINRLVIWNRTDGNLHARLDDAKLALLDADRQPLWTTTLDKAPPVSGTYDVSGPTAVALAHADASFEQQGGENDNPYNGWPAAAAIDGDEHGSRWGWAIAPRSGEAHSAVFETQRDIAHDGGSKLRLELVHSYGAQHTLGRFKIYATDAPRPVRWLPDDIRQIAAIAPDQRTAEQQQRLAAYYRAERGLDHHASKQIAAIENRIRDVKPINVPVMQELPENKQRPSHIMIRGSFLSPGDPVEPNVLSAFHPLPTDAPRNRLGMARWIVSKDNPLTARVMVNRLWGQLLGRGLVETEEDFGTQGAAPTHPELLDWLAVEFMHRDWNVKAMIKQIVMSATYRQSSAVGSRKLELDPRNELLSRHPRTRLSAEQVRDQALALSGLLSEKIGGPSVYPPQPPNMWRAAFNGQRNYPTSTGEDRYRRGLYTIWRRTVPYPSMAIFEAPSRELCTMRRIATNTPMHAFVTLNDPVYVEMAQALARRIVSEGGATAEQRAAWALKLCTARPPSAEQVEAIVQLFDAEYADYRANPDDASALAADPLGPLPKDADPAEYAAWTVVANVLLNMDAVLMKG